ncbi:MAG: response regulator [Methanomicrobium sp.]|nr:response regulator [Methanomicrobium sp.]
MVDEQPEILEIASIYLKKYSSYTIDEAYSATEALSLLRLNPYDAIVSDYDMPEMDGLTFLKEVRKVDQSIPFIIFSGKGREQVVLEAFRCGADGYVQKGKDPRSQFAELNHQIEIASKRRAAESELRMKEYAIEISFNATIMFDENQLVLYSNKAATELHGYGSKDEIIGRNLSELFDFSLEDNGEEGFFSSLSESGWYFGEIEGIKEDGGKFDAQLSVIRITNLIKKETYYFSSYIDITEKKKAEKALLEFITEATRRLKEPLTHICRNLVETIEQIEYENEPEKMKMKLSVQVKNTQQVIENLKELNKSISNGFDLISEDYRDYFTR